MGKYIIDINQKKRVSANTMITVVDTEKNETYKFTKISLTRGYPLEYNQELCEALFEVDDMLYKWFPVEFRTDEMTKRLIEKYYKRFYEYYPTKFRDKDMTREYIRFSGSHLFYVPKDQISQEICDLYALANPDGLREVPDEFMKEEYINYILRKGYHLGIVPYEYRTIEVCLKFIKDCPSNIEFVPDEILAEICQKTGIMYHENLNLDSTNYWMKKKKKD